MWVREHLDVLRAVHPVENLLPGLWGRLGIRRVGARGGCRMTVEVLQRVTVGFCFAATFAAVPGL